jgi:probable F420-dependent oxidoreductase
MIELIRHIWDVWQNGTKPGFQGKHYQFSLMTPFFSPPPLEWPHIPIYIAAVNPYMYKMAGEICDGVQVHPFHSIKFMNEIAFPALDAGLAKSGRKRSDVTLATSAFVITGRNAKEIDQARASVRQQISFYASTRTYSAVLEAHGWGETSFRLNEKAAKGDWGGMASLITDEMLDVYAVTGPLDEVPALLKKKYTGVIDRISFYSNLLGGIGDDEWQRVIAACRS